MNQKKMSKFYGDLLRDYENRSRKNFYSGTPVYLKFKTSPSAATTLAQSYRLTRTVETKGTDEIVSYNAANGTTLKSVCHNKELATKIKIGNSGVNYELTYKPADYNNADKTIQVKHATRFDTKTSRLDSTETVKIGTPQVGPIRLWATLDFLWNNANDSRSLKGTASVNYEDYHVGVKFDHDATNNKVKTVLAQALLKNAGGDYFLLADVLRKQFTLGCHHRHGTKAAHVYEIVYDVNKTIKGVCGQPALFNWAGEYVLTDFATVKSKVRLGA